jgi:hypothetical protein
MATTPSRTPDQILREIETEREQLVGAVEHLRGELGEATNVAAKLKSRLPVAAAGAATAGFVLAGGIGATLRYLARRGRDGHEQLRVGRWSLSGRR